MPKVKFVFLNFLIYILFVSCGNENKNGKDIPFKDESTIDTLYIVKEIKKQCTEIDSKLSLYDKVEKVLLDESTEGAELTGYYGDKKLKKITGIYYRETGKSLVDYYYNGEEFICVYAKIFNYERPIYIDYDPKIKSTERDTFYFYNENLIKWISDSVEIAPQSKKFIEESNFLKEDFEKYKKIFILK